EIVGEQEGRARSVRAMDHNDRLRRQLHVGIELRDCGIVPGLDLAEEDFRQRRAVERKLAGLDAFEVDDRNDATHYGRELGEAILVGLGSLERHVGRAEGHGLGLDLLDAAARADRLIVQANASLFLVGVRPLRIDRIREGRAGAGNVGGYRWCEACRGDDASGREGWEQSHCLFLLSITQKLKPARAPVPRWQTFGFVKLGYRRAECVKRGY